MARRVDSWVDGSIDRSLAHQIEGIGSVGFGSIEPSEALEVKDWVKDNRRGPQVNRVIGSLSH